ncbi:hypothetical protein [Aquisphaera insulae]|uniref:hypothetical protein n=1 Tax=Aquisphaera insulae TaxID=2712864 RepID=UPI0013ED80AA|nr:hypothetical protein [Aquisphaera insulae]
MNEGILIPIFALLVPIVVAPTGIIMKYRQRKREMLHRERIRAIELGMPVPPGDHGLGLSIPVIGGCVPIAAILGALLLSMFLFRAESDAIPMVAIVWAFATAISVAALVTALILGYLAARSSRPVEQPASFKSVYDPDAYDVVSSRG